MWHLMRAPPQNDQGYFAMRSYVHVATFIPTGPEYDRNMRGKG
jgi:hypothetical protein